MKNISALSHERLLALVRYDPVTGFFHKNALRRGCRPNKILGNVDPRGYRYIRIDYRRYRASRLAWFYVNGVWPADEIDHKNLRKGDDWFENLRPASRSQNQANTRTKLSKAGLKGVYWCDGKWRARIQIDGKRRSLGCFDMKLDAHQAYAAAAAALYGEFARVA